MTEPTEPSGLAVTTSDAALSLDEAQPLTSRRGALIALMLGEVGTGKTTLLVELWTAFMVGGKVGDCAFAGSATSLAFEARAYGSRLASGSFPGETLRTAEADDGFLHLRLSRAGVLLPDLLLADITGEHSQHIREGRPLEDELPWASRVDRFLVLVDGAAFRDTSKRENALNRAKRLLFQLQASPAVGPSSRVAVVLSKSDALRSSDRRTWREAEQALLDIARQTDPQAIALRTAARPADHSPPVGLQETLDFLFLADRAAPRTAPSSPSPQRAMSRMRA